MEKNEPIFEILHMPPENTNSVLVSQNGNAVIFDAWGHTEDWEKLLSERRLNLRAIYSTHGHSDHISAAPMLAEKYNIPWFLNSDDKDLIIWGNSILDFFNIPRIESNHKESEDLRAGFRNILPSVQMQVIETPGHSKGGLSFYFPDYKILLTGDTLFRDSFGRYDLPGGDANVLSESISKLYELDLPDDTYVVHGHGIDSTIEILKHQNPYFVKRKCCHGEKDCRCDKEEHHCCHCHGKCDCE